MMSAIASSQEYVIRMKLWAEAGDHIALQDTICGSIDSVRDALQESEEVQCQAVDCILLHCISRQQCTSVSAQSQSCSDHKAEPCSAASAITHEQAKLGVHFVSRAIASTTGVQWRHYRQILRFRAVFWLT